MQYSFYGSMTILIFIVYMRCKFRIIRVSFYKKTPAILKNSRSFFIYRFAK